MCYIEYNNYISIYLYLYIYIYISISSIDIDREIDLQRDRQIYRDIDLQRSIEIQISHYTIDKAYIRANKWDRGDAYDFTFKYLLLKASVVVNNHSKLCPIIRNKLKAFFVCFCFCGQNDQSFYSVTHFGLTMLIVFSRQEFQSRRANELSDQVCTANTLKYICIIESYKYPEAWVSCLS